MHWMRKSRGAARVSALAGALALLAGCGELSTEGENDLQGMEIGLTHYKRCFENEADATEPEAVTTTDANLVAQSAQELSDPAEQSAEVLFTDRSALVGVGDELGGVAPYEDEVQLSPQQQWAVVQGAAEVIEDDDSDDDYTTQVAAE